MLFPPVNNNNNNINNSSKTTTWPQTPISPADRSWTLQPAPRHKTWPHNSPSWLVWRRLTGTSASFQHSAVILWWWAGEVVMFPLTCLGCAGMNPTVIWFDKNKAIAKNKDNICEKKRWLLKNKQNSEIYVISKVKREDSINTKDSY